MTDLTDWGDQSLRVAIIADTHGFLHPGIVDLIADCHVAIHAGDIGSQAVLASMVPASGLVFAVAGNNDTVSKWTPSETDVVSALPKKQSIVAPGGTLVVEHGHTVRDTRRYHEVLRSRHPESRAIVYGHTHVRCIDQDSVPWVLNPGAAGRERTRGGASCLVLAIQSNDWRVTEHCFAR